MTNNLELWGLVERTDPKHVKAITGKPYRGSSPKPYWLIKRATEVFGPAGLGWGFKILSERVEDGSAGDKVHIAHIQVWYEWNGKRGEVEHVGQTMIAGKNKNGPYTDEDAPKKSVTDALVKALSMIGFAGDIFMGRYDDSKYVAETDREFREEERRDAPVTSDVMMSAEKALEDAAARGTASLKQAWLKLPPATRELFGGKAPERLKTWAAEFDKRDGKAAA